MNENQRDRPHTIRILWMIFAIMLVLSVVAEILIHTHTRFGIDGSFGFYAWFGGLACAGIVTLSKFLGILLKRKDTFYDD